MDNHFKHKLQRFRVDWDKEALWEELEPKLPQRKRRFLWYWWVLIPLILASAGWGVRSQWLQASSIEEQNVAVQSSEEQAKQQSDIAIATVEEERVLFIAENEEEQTPVLSQIRPSATPSPQISYKYTPTQHTNLYYYSSLNTEPALEEKEVLLPTIVTATAKSNVDKGYNTIKVHPTVASVATREKVAVLQTLPIKPLQDDGAQEAPFGVLTEAGKMTRPFRSKTQGAFVNVLAGVGTLQRQDDYTAVEPVIVEYRRTHSERLNPQAEWNVQLEAGYRHVSGFSLSTGLGYRQLHEQFNFDGVDLVDTIIDTNDRARYFVKPSGDTLFLSGPGVYAQLVNKQVLHNNQVSYYQIPLLLAYRFPKKRWDIELTAGINYLLRSQYRGRISEGFPARITDDPGIELKRRWGYTMRVGVQYQLLPATYLYLNTQLMQSPKFLRLDVGQQYRSLGMQVGLQYRFFGGG